MKTNITILQALLIGLILFITAPLIAGVSSNSSSHGTEVSMGSKKKKVKKKGKQDSKDRKIKNKALISFVAGIIGLGSTIAAIPTASLVLMILGLCFSVIAMIMGLVTLFRKNKSKQAKMFGVLGVILGGSVFLAYLIMTIAFFIGGIDPFVVG